MQRKIAAGTGVISALATAAGAQCPRFEHSLLLVEGDLVGGVGAITEFGRVAVNDYREWLVEAETDHPDPLANSVLLQNGDLRLREGQPMAEPRGTLLDSINAFSIDVEGHVLWAVQLRVPLVPESYAAVYINGALLLREGDVAMAPGFSPGTRYRGFRWAKFRHVREALLAAEVDDPAIPGDTDEALVIYDTSAVTERILFKEGDVPPQQSEPIEALPPGPQGAALDRPSRTLVLVDLAGPADRDTALYLDEILLAQEGGPSAVSGRNWASLEDGAVAIAGGHPAVRLRLDGDPGSDEVIARWITYVSPGRWEIVAQKGGPVPGVPGATITGFGAGPVAVDAYEGAFWFAAWDGGEGIFREDEPVVIAGATVVEGRLVTGVASAPGAFAVSEGGYSLLARVTLDGAQEAIIFIETLTGLGCYADCDCSGSLDFFDYLCFQNAFAAGEPYGDCDASGTLDFFDFLCYQDSWAC